MTGRQDQYRTPHRTTGPTSPKRRCAGWSRIARSRASAPTAPGSRCAGVTHYPNHRLLNEAGIPVLECLTNLTELRSQRVFLIALPWPVQGLDACPVRAIAIEPEA